MAKAGCVTTRKRPRRRDQDLRGEHKKSGSPETQRWEREHLIPECPPWMSRDTYLRLAQLRHELDDEEQAA